MYLWDTNIASAAMADHPKIEERLTPTPRNDIAIAAITRGEILYGIARLPEGKRKSRFARKAEGMFAITHCIWVDENVADAYAAIRATLDRLGKPIGKENDLWIAAVAVAYNCTLVTDQGSFTHVPGVKVENWLAADNTGQSPGIPPRRHEDTEDLSTDCADNTD